MGHNLNLRLSSAQLKANQFPESNSELVGSCPSGQTCITEAWKKRTPQTFPAETVTFFTWHLVDAQTSHPKRWDLVIDNEAAAAAAIRGSSREPEQVPLSKGARPLARARLSDPNTRVDDRCNPSACGPKDDAFLGPETQMDPIAYSVRFGRTVGSVEVGTLESIDLMHMERIRFASSARPLSVTGVFRR